MSDEERPESSLGDDASQHTARNESGAGDGDRKENVSPESDRHNQSRGDEASSNDARANDTESRAGDDPTASDDPTTSDEPGGNAGQSDDTGPTEHADTPDAADPDDEGTEGDASADLRERIDELESALAAREERIGELESQLKRKQADFQNYKKRQKKRQEQRAASATENLVERLLDVRDNLKRALEAEHDDVDALREGVKMTLSEFDRVLDAENVAEIEPEPGTDVDPQRHEVLIRVESDQPEDTIAEVYQPGYELGEKVLRAAQVTVSDGGGSEGEETDEAAEPSEDDRGEGDRTAGDRADGDHVDANVANDQEVSDEHAGDEGAGGGHAGSEH